MAADEGMARYRDLFVQEATEHIQGLNSSLLRLEDDPKNKEHLGEAFRAAHTLKGMAATMGYDAIRQLCVLIEDLFDNFRNEKAELNSEIAGHLFKSFDSLSRMVADGGIISGNEGDVIEKLKGALEVIKHQHIPAGGLDTVSASSNQHSNLAGSVPTEIAERGNQSASSQQPQASRSSTIRVKMEDMDSIVDLVGEIMISKMRLEQSIRSLSSFDTAGDVGSLLQSLGRLIADLQYQSMKIRLVPTEQIFDRFPRMVRDLASSLHKDIKFELNAGGIELDRTIVDAINDPLLHMLRNAIDHGIELPEVRVQKGKPAAGTIRLTAFRVGERVSIEIADDGAGIDLERVKKKAIEEKLITKDRAASISDQDVMALIGTPGLSTAKEVTDVSGRGVGMDVVFKKIESVGGQTRIQTQKDKGTTITLTIPLSLAIIGGLLIGVRQEKYVIPISNVISVIKFDKESIKLINGQQVIMMYDRVIPLLSAASLVGLESLLPETGSQRIVSPRSPEVEASSENNAKSATEIAISDKLTAVLIDKNGSLVALQVASVESKQDIVVKHIHKCGFETEATPTDATILHDGRVALVLDATQFGEAT